jgi:hypothetical protein
MGVFFWCNKEKYYLVIIKISFNNSNPTLYRKLKITIVVSSCDINDLKILEMKIE